MKIFIDESGRFIPGDGWSIVCALSLPHQFSGPAQRELARLTKDWAKIDGELKGALVSVDQLASLVDCLYRFDAIVHCCACDVSRHENSAIAEHQAEQAVGITRYLVDTHHPEMIAKVWSLRRVVERMPAQLYIQSVLMRELVCVVSEETSHYFAQRKPKELGKYEWFIDAKDPTGETSQERWWKDVLGPLIESRSRRKPFGLVDAPEFNYFFLERSYAFTKEMWFPDKPRQTINGFDLKKMFTDATSFVDSKSNILVQGVDVLARYLRLALRAQTIDEAVLRHTGRLQIQRKRGRIQQSMNLMSVGRTALDTKAPELARRMRVMTANARSIWK